MYAVADLLSQPPAELIRPDYSIYRFTDQIYKVVRFRSTAPLHLRSDASSHQTYDKKLDASMSRSRRVVLELALCNPWKYFCTFTIAQDRKDLESWAKRFSQWIRDQRKKYNMDFPYVLVPEQHQDGSWHMHGLFGDISPLLVPFAHYWSEGKKIPYKLVKGGYLDFPNYSRKFGFCSFGPIKNPVAAGFYITKYISKNLQDSCLDVGLHLYYCSHGLNRSSKHGEVYGGCSYLDQFLVNHYDFCDTGMTSVKDGCDWTFGLEYMDFEMLEALSFSDTEEFSEVDNYYEAVQQVLEGF